MLKVCRFCLSQVMEPKNKTYHIWYFTSKGLSNYFKDRLRTLTKESTILWPVNAILCFLQMCTLITWSISAILKWAASPWKPFTVQKATRNLVDGKLICTFWLILGSFEYILCKMNNEWMRSLYDVQKFGVNKIFIMFLKEILTKVEYL